MPWLFGHYEGEKEERHVVLDLTRVYNTIEAARLHRLSNEFIEYKTHKELDKLKKEKGG